MIPEYRQWSSFQITAHLKQQCFHRWAMALHLQINVADVTYESAWAQTRWGESRIVANPQTSVVSLIMEDNDYQAEQAAAC